jgi:hypothetical protein
LLIFGISREKLFSLFRVFGNEKVFSQTFFVDLKRRLDNINGSMHLGISW